MFILQQDFNVQDEDARKSAQSVDHRSEHAADLMTPQDIYTAVSAHSNDKDCVG